MRIRSLTTAVVAATSGAGSVGGIVHNAISGIDAAMWDAHARLLGVPLWEFLGGRFRDSVRVYADCHAGAGLMSLGPVLDIRTPRWLTPGQVASGTAGAMLFDVGAETEPVDPAHLRARAKEVVEAGFDALKFDLDVPGLVPVHPGSRTAPAGAEHLIMRIVAAIREGAGAETGSPSTCTGATTCRRPRVSLRHCLEHWPASRSSGSRTRCRRTTSPACSRCPPGRARRLAAARTLWDTRPSNQSSTRTPCQSSRPTG